MDDIQYEQDRHEFLQDVYGLGMREYYNEIKVAQ